MNINKAITGLLSVAALSVVASASFAGNITPGGPAIGPVPLSSETGTLITSQTNTFVSPLNTYTGSLYSAVYKETTGTLDFVFQVQNNASSTDALERISGGMYLGFNPSAFYSTQAGGLGTGTVAPSSANETNSGGVGFNFVSGGIGTLLPGNLSDVLIVQTNATNYTNSQYGVLDSTSTNVQAYAPTAVPEPATVVPFALGGLALLGLIVRKTRRTNSAAA